MRDAQDDMKKGNTIRRSLEEIRERRRRGINEIDWDPVESMTGEEIERNALEDNQRHGVDDDWYKGAQLVRGDEGHLTLTGSGNNGVQNAESDE